MSANDALRKLCGEIKLNENEDFYVSVGEIAKKLNKVYYDLDSDSSSHMYVVGSVGRKTAIKNSSDIDVLFNLPHDLYLRFNSYDSNGQSALLQEIKNTVADRYPNTNLKGDGQVVSITFDKYTIELVPAFIQSDNSFLFPDSGEGGKWKITNPIAEQKECKATYSKSSYYYDVCRLTRKWKNNIGFEFKGLLIDTLVHDYLLDEKNNPSNLMSAFVGALEFYSKQNKNQSYWYALGSNQQIYNDDNGRFVSKAKSAINKLSKCKSDEEVNDVFSDLLGRGYPKQNSASWKEKMQLRLKNYRDTEEFIEDHVPVDIRYDLKIDCEVEQRGFRPFLLSAFLEEGRKLLKIKKGLDFYIAKTNCPKPYEIYWKVKNVGKKAIERDDIRGQILKTNETKHHENTKFMGRHYVECYLIKNGTCVARDRITVPIGEEE